MIIFPSSPLAPKQPDDSFKLEYEAAKAIGTKIGLVDIELLLGGEVRLRFPDGEDNYAIYRGWILKPEQQLALENALAPSCKLINSSKEYNFLYNIPNWLYCIDTMLSPNTIIIPGTPDKLIDYNFNLSEFGDKPIMIKDYLKSRKQDWFDACYIYSASDTAEVKRVVNNFIELQGSSFVGGIVFREFINLKNIGIHTKSKMPLTNEHRYFMFNHNILAHYNYWSEGNYTGNVPSDLFIQGISRKLFARAPHKITNLFYTIDIAEKEDGGWLVIELGDGGSCGIPDNGDPKILYNSLISHYEL